MPRVGRPTTIAAAHANTSGLGFIAIVPVAKGSSDADPEYTAGLSHEV
jgi:hypothetical protein